MARLIFIGEKFAGRVYEFIVPKTTVGRGDDNTLTIHDASVSHRHCEIYAYGPDVIVRDLGSSNGTFVNGERLHNQQRPLTPGQTVKFGSVEARLEAQPASASDDETDVTAIHAHARHLREPQKKPAPAALTLDAGAESNPADHTLVMPRPPETEQIPGPSMEKGRVPQKDSNRTAIILGLVIAVLAAVVVLWLVWVRR